MRFYNEVTSDLAPGGRRFSILIDRLGDKPDILDLADDWCRGYTLGFALREDEWKEAMGVPELQDAFIPILLLAHPEKAPELDPVKNPEQYAAAINMLPDCATKIYEWWREKFVASMPDMRARVETVRRATPKVSANAACPCGSGKKYKRCCSSLRAV
jgi:uncharacterized protein YecA (UPF0149 family)